MLREHKYSGRAIYSNKYIPEGFKRCRMNKRNRSARLSLAEPLGHPSIPNKYRQLIQGSRIRHQVKEHMSVDL
jgi:hypothetical protein